MNKIQRYLFSLLLLMVSQCVMADSPPLQPDVMLPPSVRVTTVPVVSEKAPPIVSPVISSATVADIKLELISSLKKDGYLSEKMANEVALKYVSKKDQVALNTGIKKDLKIKEGSVTDYLSWINFLKVCGVILLLVAFHKVVLVIVGFAITMVIVVPIPVYQVVLLSATTVGLVHPEWISVSQSSYVVLFSAFANLGLLSWAFLSGQRMKMITDRVVRLFHFLLPPTWLVFLASFALPAVCLVYFSALAIVYHSSIFGFCAAVCLSGLLSFGMLYSPGVLALYFKENKLAAVVFGHLVIVCAYVNILLSAAPLVAGYLTYFDAGIQYYSTIGLGVGLLVGASPYYRRAQALPYLLLFIAIFFAATFGYFLYGLKVIGSIITIFFILIALEWIGYLVYKSGIIIGAFISGATLFGLSMLLEKYGSVILLALY